jgi:cytochrome c oxidase assembly factor CtaG
MAGFLIAGIACVLSFALGALGIGRPRVVLGVGGVLAVGWIISLAAKRPADSNDVLPLWFVTGLVLLLYAIWCGGLWLGVRLRRIRRATPG